MTHTREWIATVVDVEHEAAEYKALGWWYRAALLRAAAEALRADQDRDCAQLLAMAQDVYR
jgi:hypothetical protein